jgi:protoheme IX farnesyltransferase
MIGTSITPRNQNFLEVIKSYYLLTKPRIIPLLLITTASSMFIASSGNIEPTLFLTTLMGGTLAAASAQTFNCIYDQDIDYEMKRTRNRPIPSGKVHPNHALIFGIILAIISFTLLTVFVNLLAALLAMCGIVFYLLVYTHWLKRTTTQNIVIGGAAGAIPPLVGWAAVTGDLSWTAWALFIIIFLWTPPHFWALALMIADDYAEVEVPMLPVVQGEESTVNQIWVYTWIMIGSTFALVYMGSVGLVYFLLATILGIIFVQKAWRLLFKPKDKQLARSLFKYSILYMMLLCTSMVIDSLPLSNQLTIAIADNISRIF